MLRQGFNGHDCYSRDAFPFANESEAVGGGGLDRDFADIQTHRLGQGIADCITMRGHSHFLSNHSHIDVNRFPISDSGHGNHLTEQTHRINPNRRWVVRRKMLTNVTEGTRAQKSIRDCMGENVAVRCGRNAYGVGYDFPAKF